MTQKDLFGNVISSPQDTHVNRSQSQGDKKEKKTLDTSIRTYLKLLHPKDPLGSFSKTLAVTSHWASTRCLLTWHLKTTPQGYLLFQLRPSALPTKEIDSGSSDEMWATPNTMDHLPQRSEESTKKMQEGHRKGRTRPSNLREQVDEETMKMFPTPRANEPGRTTKGYGRGLAELVEGKEQLWPTPRANKVHPVITEENREQLANRNKGNLEEVVAGEVGGATGQLNPTWVEWLMGYPEGWTELKD